MAYGRIAVGSRFPELFGMIIYGLPRGYNDANLMPVLRQIINSGYIATGYSFLNFLSTVAGGAMVYLGGALNDSNIDLALLYQIIAVVMQFSARSLLIVKLKREG